MYRHEGKWVISDDITDTFFDKDNKEKGINCAELIEKFDEAQNNPSDEIVANLTPERSAIPQSIPYKGENAKQYAYLYTTSSYPDGTYSRQYYNRNFVDHSARGDCQNFASQCVRAGFSGSDDPTSINNKTLAPNDGVGGVNREWHANPSEHWAWTHVPTFEKYIQNSSLTDTTMRADTYEIDANNNSMTGVSNYSASLLGAVIHNGANSHAVVVDTPGATRDQTYICGHTEDVKHKKLSMAFPLGTPITVYVLKYFHIVSDHQHTYSTISSGIDSVCNVSGCGYCRLYPYMTYLGCVPVNSNKTIYGYSNIGNIFRMAIKVTSPSGGETWLTAANGASTIARSYTFYETGLYDVTLYARDITDSNQWSKQVSCSMKVRVY